MAATSANDTINLLFNDEELDSIIASLEFELEEEKLPDKKEFKCSLCTKVCVSQRGLTRHIGCKHPETVATKELVSIEERIPSAQFQNIVLQSIMKLSLDNCYPEEICKQFNNLKSKQDFDTVYQLVKDVVQNFKGDIEKFYPDFYALFKNGNILTDLNHQCNILFGCELANNILAFLTKSKIVNDTLDLNFEMATTFNAKDKEILSYLSGYVVATMYRRLRFSKKEKGMYHQHCLSILIACKYVEGSETNTSHHRLIELKDRGGLWKVKHDVVVIFSIAESCFLSATKDFVTQIDSKLIVSKLMENPSIIASFNAIRRLSEEKVSKEIAFNLLEDMVTLYIRLRSHSFAKDKKQQHKMKKDSTKKRSLRTELKKQSSSLDTGH